MPMGSRESVSEGEARTSTSKGPPALLASALEGHSPVLCGQSSPVLCGHRSLSFYSIVSLPTFGSCYEKFSRRYPKKIPSLSKVCFSRLRLTNFFSIKFQVVNNLGFVGHMVPSHSYSALLS